MQICSEMWNIYRKYHISKIDNFKRTDLEFIDCEQFLIFLCKVTARETQARERRSRDKPGRKHEKKKVSSQSLIVTQRRGLQWRWLR